MPDTALPSHEAILRLCAAAAPKPWYPKVYAQSSGVPRDSLDAPLNDLRVAGLIRLTEWEKGPGQGYVLTEFGEEVLKNPVFLAQLRAGGKPAPQRIERPDEPEAPRREEPTTYERGEQARAALYEPSPPRVMPVLLLVNLLAFGVSFVVAMRGNVPINQFVAKGDANALHEVGALSAWDLVDAEWWRLLSSAFLHFGLLHLALNMVALYSLGLLESLWGPPRFLIIYLISALGGNCVAMIYDPGPPTARIVLAGASGAIWGLMTSLVAWLFMNRRHLPPQEVSRWLNRLVPVFLINVGVSFIPGVSASAHFGGGIVGFIAATLLHVQRVAPPPRRTAATVLLILLPVVCVAALAEVIQKDPRWQRIRERAQAIKHQQVVQSFRQEVVPAIDRADGTAEALISEFYILTDGAPAKRPAAIMGKAREHLKEAQAAVGEALEKLHERPKEDERLEAAFDRGRDYMLALADLLGKFEQLLDRGEAWDKEERIKVEARRRSAREAWRAARNQL